MAIDTTKVTAFINALKAKFEEKSNKVTAWSNETTDTNYPSEKLVKDSLDAKLDASDVPTKTSDLTNDGDGVNAFLTQHAPVDSSLDNSSTNAVQNATVTTALSGKEVASNKVTSWGSNDDNATDTNYPSAKLVKDTLDTKIEESDLPTKTSDLTNDGSDGVNPFLTAHQSLSDIGGAVTIEKATSNIDGNLARYTIKQGGSAIAGGTIDVPKDYLVKSATVQTVGATGAKTANELGTGFTTGDKYMDFVINTKSNDGTDEHMYINVKDLVEDTTYTADEDTLQLVNGEFSVKQIDTTELASGIVTSLGYADAFNVFANGSESQSAHPCTTITANDINSWNAKSNLTTANVDTEIEAYLTAITNELNGVTSS